MLNLIGILFENKRGNSFKNIHSVLPSLLAKLCKEYSIEHFIHLSALGINEAKDSDYAKSKLEGEDNVLRNFPLSTILRPSVVYSVDDNFTTNFMTLLSRMPVFPIYYRGETKFAPIHCSDLTDIIYHVISKKINSKIIECTSRNYIFQRTFGKIIIINWKKIVSTLPLPIAELTARFFEILPNPLLTRDQLRLLKYNNIPTGKYKTNSDIGVPSKRFFDQEVKKYCYMWKVGGQFSTEKYQFKKSFKNNLND